MVNRRQSIRGGVVGGAALLVPAAVLVRRSAQAQPVPGGTLDPARVPKYVTPPFVLPAMPTCGGPSGVDSYSIAARQFNQQILPPGFPSTPVFGYGSTTDSGTFHTPAHTIEARVSRPVRVTWANQLVTGAGDFRPPLVTVDQTLHWANPPGGLSGRDIRSEFTRTPGPYRGPVPLVTHLHGAHVFEESDGYPEAWYLPVARNISRGYATVGSWYDRFKAEANGRTGVTWAPGTATYQYPNDQRATNLWYHSHEPGMTRTTIYSGLSGMSAARRPVRPSARRAARTRAAPRRVVRAAPLRGAAGHPGPFVSTPTARCSSRPAAGSSGTLRRTARGSPRPTSLHSGIPSSSATPSWSTAAPGRSSRSRRAGTGCACSTRATPGSYC